MTKRARLTAADDQHAELDPYDLLAVIAGAPNPDLTVRVQRVLAHALDERVYPDAPPSPEDEVLRLDFRHVFTRDDVARLLSTLTAG